MTPDDAMDIYVPGRWRCLKCQFQLSSATLFVASGEIGCTRDQVMRMDGECCPNDGTAMVRVTWREDSDHNRQWGVDLMEEIIGATYAASLPEALESARRYRKALESIAASACCDRCNEAKLVAAAALRGAQSVPAGATPSATGATESAHDLSSLLVALRGLVTQWRARGHREITDTAGYAHADYLRARRGQLNDCADELDALLVGVPEPPTTNEEELSRQSPSVPWGTTGSPRSPQPEGSVLSALRQRLEPVARREHYQAVGASALFSVEHWKHNAGPEWPHEPDDDSFTAFENCKHPLCAAVRPDDPVRIGAFDYTENADGTIVRKDWRQP